MPREIISQLCVSTYDIAGGFGPIIKGAAVFDEKHQIRQPPCSLNYFQEIKQKPNSKQVKQWVNIFALSGSKVKNNVADYSYSNPVGDAVGKRHHNTGQYSREHDSFLVPFKGAYFIEHMNSGDDKYWSSNRWYGGHGLSYWEQEYHENKQQSGHYSRKTSTGS